MALIPHAFAASLFSSTSTLTIVTEFPNSSANLSNYGAIIAHGGHHTAEKSMTTSLNLLLSISLSNSTLVFISGTCLAREVIVADELPV